MPIIVCSYILTLMIYLMCTVCYIFQTLCYSSIIYSVYGLSVQCSIRWSVFLPTIVIILILCFGYCYDPLCWEMNVYVINILYIYIYIILQLYILCY